MESNRFLKSFLSTFIFLFVVFGGLMVLNAQAWADTIDNPPSTYSHTVDGLFTDWSSSPPTTYEWYDITPQAGAYSFVYFDYTGSQLFIMNDWYINTEGMLATDYNQFTINAGADNWELRVYGDGSTSLLKNGVPDATAQGAYGWGISPNSNVEHTMWEVAIYVGPGEILEDPADPKRPGEPNVRDPKFPLGFKITLKDGGGSTSSPVPVPSAILLFGTGLTGLAFERLRKKFRK